MAEAKKTEQVTEVKKPDKVPILINLDANPNAPTEEFFSVNGKNYIIKKGQTVMVPPEVAEVYYNSQKQMQKNRQYVDSVGLREPK